MNVIALSYVDLAAAAALVAGLAGLSHGLGLGLARPLLVAAVRTAAQLLLIGFVLEMLFANGKPGWVLMMALFMLSAAALEVFLRQKRSFTGVWGMGIGAAALLLSTFSVTVLALTAFVGAEPWYTPRYAVPLLGMVLGNTMTAVALGLDTLKESAWRQRMEVEGRLLLGQTWQAAISDIRRESMRVGMIPVINAMAAAGLISLPGMMTGQLLAGSPPIEAVKYQVLIMFLIAASTGLGSVFAVSVAARRLFDERHRLRLDRLRPPGRGVSARWFQRDRGKR